jgi:DNA-binding Lrp family transcriptional regulator
MKRLSAFEIQRNIVRNALFSKVKLSPTARLTLLSLATYYNQETKTMYPSQSRLAREIGCRRPEVCNSIREIEKIGLIISAGKLGENKTYSFTKIFYDLILSDIEPQNNLSEKQTPPVGKTDTPLSEKQTQINKVKNKIKEKDFSFILKLSKTDVIAYYDEVSKLSVNQKEQLAKIKLSRTNLTDFQKLNMHKIIMLSEYEINKLSTLEPYYKQENIDIWYNQRVNKIIKFKQEKAA